MKSIKHIFIILFLLAMTSLFAAPISHWFEQANAFYEKQNYDSTLTYYQKIIDEGIEYSDIYFNTGNTYFRKNQLGKAILCYEKALKLSPRDNDIISNLKFARLTIIDRIAEPEKNFFEQLILFFHTIFYLDTQLWILLILISITCIAIAISIYVSHNSRLWLIYLSVLSGLLSITIGISVGYKIYAEEKSYHAIVLDAEVDALNSPDGNKTLFTVHEGVKFKIIKTNGNWSLVSLPNGVSGWVKSVALGLI